MVRMVKELDILSDKPIKVNLGKVLQSNLLADYGPELPLEIWAKAAPDELKAKDTGRRN